MAEYNKVCHVCGVQFMAGRDAKYCPECRKKILKAPYHKTERSALKQRQQLMKKKPAYGFKPAKCPDDCLYLQMFEGKRCMCGYLLTTGEVRGCDPGIGCNRYVGLNEDEKAAKHRRVKWDVVTGKKLWEAGWKDSLIAKVMRVKPDTVKAYRLRVWEKEKNHD